MSCRVSDAWGVKTSDKYLAEQCGILNLLLPGGMLLADRDFNISESVDMMQARLHIPAFTKGKDKLYALEMLEFMLSELLWLFDRCSILRGTLPIKLQKGMWIEFPCLLCYQ